MAEKYKQKDWLSKQIKEKGRSYNEIADSLGVCFGSVRYFADKYGIESTYNNNNEKEVDIDNIARLYHNEGMTASEVGERIGVSKTTVLDRMEKEGVERRAPAEETSGENHPCWEGGWEEEDSNAAFYWSYEWRETREEVIERDNRECTQCGDEPDRPVVHHLIPIEKGGDKFDKRNLITVCQSCHNYLHQKVYL
jgi:5-methylcytosine-specific restriction protein A